MSTVSSVIVDVPSNPGSRRRWRCLPLTYCSRRKATDQPERDTTTSCVHDNAPQYGLTTDSDRDRSLECPFCGTENQSQYSECRTCGRPLNLKQQSKKEEKQAVLERLAELDEKGVLDKLQDLDSA